MRFQIPYTLRSLPASGTYMNQGTSHPGSAACSSTGDIPSCGAALSCSILDLGCTSLTQRSILPVASHGHDKGKASPQ